MKPSIKHLTQPITLPGDSLISEEDGSRQVSTWEIAERFEHFKELFSLKDEELRVLIDAEYIDREDRFSKEKLGEDDQYFQLLLYSKPVQYLDSGETDLSFKADYRLPTTEPEHFTEVVYPQTIQNFEEEYGDTLDKLLYRDPDEMLEGRL